MKRFWFLSPKNIIASIKSVWQPLPTAEKPAECPDKLEPVGSYSGLYNRVMKSTTTGQQESRVFDVVTPEQQAALEMVPVINGGGGSASYGPELVQKPASVAGLKFANVSKVAKENPGDPAAHYNAGAVLFRLEYYDLALPAFERAQALSGPDYDAMIYMAKCHIALGDRKAAEALLEKAQSNNKFGFEACLGLGQVCLDRRETQKALDFFNVALDTGHSEPAAHPDLIEAYKGKLSCLFAMVDGLDDEECYDLWTKIDQCLYEAQREAPRDPYLDMHMAELYCADNSYEAAYKFALDAIAKAKNIEGQDPEALSLAQDLRGKIDTLFNYTPKSQHKDRPPGPGPNF